MRLTEDQVPVAYGGKGWCASHIKKELINEKIKGDTQFQKTYNTCYLTKKIAKNHGELPKPYVKNTHPAIIEEHVWNLVQLELLRQEQYCTVDTIIKVIVSPLQAESSVESVAAPLCN